MEAIENGEMSAVVMIDQSAAFDCVDHRILRDKLALYGFDPDALTWIESYLSEREQSCHVEGFTSCSLFVSVGVPQGSILGPLLYCIFTNDFPEVVQDEDCHATDAETSGPSYSSHCARCGGVTIYADDSTYTVSDKDQEKLSEKISVKFQNMANYLTANKLKVNSDKTHLLLMMTEQKRRHHPTTVKIETGTETIETTEVERLLGAYIHQNMKWTEYIRNNDNSLLHCLNKRLGALRKIAKSA